jgi:thiol-disulfide isomerase/thioredoxin
MARTARLVALALALPLLAGGSAGERPVVVGPEGDPVALAPAPGERALLAHFWATWCPECVKELPLLEGLAAACAGSGVRVVAVNVGESPERVARYRAEHGLALPLLRDPKGAVWRRLAPRGLPANAVWSGDGDPRVEVGPRDEAAWRRALGEIGCSAPASP